MGKQNYFQEALFSHFFSNCNKYSLSLFVVHLIKKQFPIINFGKDLSITTSDDNGLSLFNSGHKYNIPTKIKLQIFELSAVDAERILERTNFTDKDLIRSNIATQLNNFHTHCFKIYFK